MWFTNSLTKTIFILKIKYGRLVDVLFGGVCIVIYLFKLTWLASE